MMRYQLNYDFKRMNLVTWFHNGYVFWHGNGMNLNLLHELHLKGDLIVFNSSFETLPYINGKMVEIGFLELEHGV